jgi:hypothetical protein
LLQTAKELQKSIGWCPLGPGGCDDSGEAKGPVPVRCQTDTTPAFGLRAWSAGLSKRAETVLQEGHPMKFRQQRAYPVSGAYLINWMNPDILKGRCTRVWNAFVQLCESEDWATKACTWNQGPLVEINSPIVGDHANGVYLHGGDTVYIHHLVANCLDSNDSADRDRGWIVWESTVLHEMVHWARYFQGKIPHGHRDYIGGVEAGKKFETLAYGCDISVGVRTCRG